MMLTTASFPVFGTPGISVASVDPVETCPSLDGLDDLVSLYQSNQYLFSELNAVQLKLSEARAYAGKAGVNRLFAEAHLLRLKARQSAVLTILRANRIEARALLARLELGAS